MNNLLKHATKELALLPEDAVIHEFSKELLLLVDAFGSSGQSGASAPLVAGIIVSCLKKLLAFQTLTPLTGDDAEWEAMSFGDSRSFYQNRRDSRVFKDDCGLVTMIGAIVWEEDGGSCFTGTVEGVSSKQPITLPGFPPEPIYVSLDRGGMIKDREWLAKMTEGGAK